MGCPDDAVTGLRADLSEGARPAVAIALYEGDRTPLGPLFLLADDSPAQVASYAHTGELLVARDGDAVVGHLLLVDTAEDGVVELKSMAVAVERQGVGLGRALVEAAIDRCRQRAARRLVVATAAADLDNLRFYQRVGFRMLRIERDVFVPARGYPEDLTVDGIPLRDQVWFDLVL